MIPPPMSPEIDALAKAMTDQQAVWWAVQCCNLVRMMQDAPDRRATAAAARWVENPSEENQIAADQAARDTDFRGPGALAAQAAAWGESPESPITREEPPQERTAPGPAAASVKIAATLLWQNKVAAAVARGDLAPDNAATTAPQQTATPRRRTSQQWLDETVAEVLSIGRAVAQNRNTWKRNP